MFDAIESLSRVATNNTLAASLAKHVAESGKPAVSDQVVISQDGALDTFHNQVGTLKNDLPGMIANAIQTQGKTGASQNDPLNAVIFRLTDPLNFILRGDSFTKEQLDGFQKEVSKFRDEVLGIKNSDALAPVIQKMQNSDALNKILFSISSHLDGIMSQIQSKLVQG